MLLFTFSRRLFIYYFEIYTLFKIYHTLQKNQNHEIPSTKYTKYLYVLRANLKLIREDCELNHIVDLRENILLKKFSPPNFKLRMMRRLYWFYNNACIF